MRKLVEVEPLFQEALQASRKVLGDEHADTLTPISNNIVGTLHIEIRRAFAQGVSDHQGRSPLDSNSDFSFSPFLCFF